MVREVRITWCLQMIVVKSSAKLWCVEAECVRIALFVCQEPAHVFSYDVKFEVDACAGGECVEVSVLEGVGDNGHAE